MRPSKTSKTSRRASSSLPLRLPAQLKLCFLLFRPQSRGRTEKAFYAPLLLYVMSAMLLRSLHLARLSPFLVPLISLSHKPEGEGGPLLCIDWSLFSNNGICRRFVGYVSSDSRLSAISSSVLVYLSGAKVSLASKQDLPRAGTCARTPHTHMVCNGGRWDTARCLFALPSFCLSGFVVLWCARCASLHDGRRGKGSEEEKCVCFWVKEDRDTKVLSGVI